MIHCFYRVYGDGKRSHFAIPRGAADLCGCGNAWGAPVRGFFAAVLLGMADGKFPTGEEKRLCPLRDKGA